MQDSASQSSRPDNQHVDGQRLDKWIWCARLVKTRTLATSLVEAGKIRINGERVRKASRRVRPGDVLTGAHGGRLWVVRVIDSAERRVPPSAVAGLYENLTPGSITERIRS
ncbi:Heat shock protein 15 [Methyloligella halotolerans]|uniref:Heat shock protein 15 n=1 Tax=Methyloligella halotolerans TaxID=1177755 RepID=A0A1E2RVB7_9HYPH|nr:RNA-binding S4 domain-containing protein [Methyloligella halotolerans]ODA66060.1 Heat shock protein 15 [Methyloligella halotolerans]